MWYCVTWAAIGVLLTLDGVSRASGIGLDCECGLSNDGFNRIVGGQVSRPHRYPWVVEMLAFGKFHCAGFIITDQYILTAGHCLRGLNAQDIIVVLGVYDIAKPGEGIQAVLEKLILHQEFESHGIAENNDIALLKLKYRIKFGPNIRPICLPPPTTDYTGFRATVAGWGRISEHGALSNVLRETTMTVLPQKTCLNTELGNQLTDSMMCASGDNTDTCKGDSGGPLMGRRRDLKFEAIGIVSWGIGCDRRHLPGVYTRIQFFLDWIHQNTADAMYCNK